MNTTYSENVAVVPLNTTVALELGLHPCLYCKSGWGNYSATTEILETCHDNCDWLKQYNSRNVKNNEPN